MDGQEIMQNLRGMLNRVLCTRLLVSSPHACVADVPIVYAILLAVATPVVSAAAFLLGALRHYAVRIETVPEQRG